MLESMLANCGKQYLKIQNTAQLIYIHRYGFGVEMDSLFR